jgi:hypothetical protein
MKMLRAAAARPFQHLDHGNLHPRVGRSASHHAGEGKYSEHVGVGFSPGPRQVVSVFEKIGRRPRPITLA